MLVAPRVGVLDESCGFDAPEVLTIAPAVAPQQDHDVTGVVARPQIPVVLVRAGNRARRQYLSKQVPWPYPPDGAYRFYKDVALPAVERGDAWHWTLRLRRDPARLIGSISLMKGGHNDLGHRGFWIAPPWQRQGFMSEACDPVTDYWFDVLKFPVLRVPKAVANAGSRRLSEKQGMRIVGTEEREYVSGQWPTEICGDHCRRVACAPASFPSASPKGRCQCGAGFRKDRVCASLVLKSESMFRANGLQRYGRSLPTSGMRADVQTDPAVFQRTYRRLLGNRPLPISRRRCGPYRARGIARRGRR